MRCAPAETPRDFDLEALRSKYARERDKRLRKDGTAQYVHVTGDMPDFWEADPHSPPVVRAPVTEDADVVIIGGGFAGLLAGAYLKKGGIEDVRIIEMGGDFGGAWYWNRYPGIQCDNESYCYIPMLEELGYMPSRRFVDGVEIHAHCRNMGRHFGLYEGALFGTMIRFIRWEEATGRWTIITNQDDEIHARFVIMATGPWSKPKLPGIPGLASFKGHKFHSARWDYEYSGGAPDNPVLNKLADKRVAVIGTGATAIQIVPYLGRFAKHLTVFQRTPSAVDHRRNDPTDPAWAASLQPGWQKERQENFYIFSGEPFPSKAPEADQTCDFFTEVGRNVAGRLVEAGRELSIEELIALREQEDYATMERIRRRINDIVTDPETAEALKPYYRYMCKRPCSSNDYLPTFNLPNVELVDVSAHKGVERITETGLVANGKEYDVDCIIFASGFEIAAQDQKVASGIEGIDGRGGLSLYDHWAEGYRTFHGMSSHGFPGLFFTGFTQGGLSTSVTAMYEQQGEHIAYIIAETMKRGPEATVEPTQEAQDEWVKTIRELAPPNTFLQECTPGYYNNEGGGHGGLRAAVSEPYAPGFYAFGDLIAAWRAKGDMPGMTLSV